MAAVGLVVASASTAAPASAKPFEGLTPDARATAGQSPQDVARRVTLVQRVEPQVVIASLRDDRISAKGADLVAISTTGSYDVPDVAMRAYKNAAQEMATIRPDCQIPWTLLAGIGRVESDHGRYGGSVLGVDGLPQPAIRGVALNGVGPVAAIADSDDGRWDGDDVWDRAVGPMQFIPTTWGSSGRDGDGDGVANPNDIDDAALAAADYLCPSSGSILSDAALDAAIYSYNHSDYYVALVRAFMTGYETGVFDLPSPPPPPAEEEPVKEEKEKKDKDSEKEDSSTSKDADSRSNESGGKETSSGKTGTTTGGGGKTGGGKTGGGKTGSGTGGTGGAGSGSTGGGTSTPTPTAPTTPTTPTTPTDGEDSGTSAESTTG